MYLQRLGGDLNKQDYQQQTVLDYVKESAMTGLYDPEIRKKCYAVVPYLVGMGAQSSVVLESQPSDLQMMLEHERAKLLKSFFRF